jgi:hypothetical protein
VYWQDTFSVSCFFHNPDGRSLGAARSGMDGTGGGVTKMKNESAWKRHGNQWCVSSLLSLLYTQQIKLTKM